MARPNSKKRTGKYPREFKTKAVQLSHLSGARVDEVAQSLSIHPNMLSKWRREFREGLLVPDKRTKVIKPRKIDLENHRLRDLAMENARLNKENELLKKFQRFLADRR